jgi:O-antigen/teichoic acid export membrane protein
MLENFRINLHIKNFRSLLLVLFALANYAIMYVAHILLARSLTVDDFGDYSVAISIVTILSTLATLGLEKYALRVVALFSDHKDWSAYRGYWLFSLRTIFCLSVLLAILLGLGMEVVSVARHMIYHFAIIIYAGFLPIIATTLFLVEYISAHGAFLLSMAVYRFFLPLVYVLILFAISLSTFALSAKLAVLSFGFAWFLALVLIWYAAQKYMPTEVSIAKPSWDGRVWLSRSIPLVVSSLLMTLMTSSGVVIMDLLDPTGKEVGSYSIAAQTGAFISLVGTSTNRYYLPLMAVMLDNRDKAAIQRLLIQRTLVVGGLILLILIPLIFEGHRLLNLFGAYFEDGYDTVIIVAIGASISALFADIPYYLQFIGFNRVVVGATLSATLSMLALGFLLGSKYGTIGVAFAYMIPVTLLFISLRIFSVLHFRKL